MFRYDLIGLLNNAADTLDALPERKYPFAGSEAFALREAAENIERLFVNRGLFDDFAQIYCLRPADIEKRAPKAVTS